MTNPIVNYILVCLVIVMLAIIGFFLKALYNQVQRIADTMTNQIAINASNEQLFEQNKTDHNVFTKRLNDHSVTLKKHGEDLAAMKGIRR